MAKNIHTKDGDPKIEAAKAALEMAIREAGRKAVALKALCDPEDKAQVKSIEDFLYSARGKLQEVLG
jgi:hypothetical protein